MHFLTVASYNLQHPAQFTAQALVGLREQFIAYLDEGVAVGEIRRRVGRLAAENHARAQAPGSSRGPVLRKWLMTVADVYIPEQPEGAADRVKRWAACIRQELG